MLLEMYSLARMNKEESCTTETRTRRDAAPMSIYVIAGNDAEWFCATTKVNGLSCQDEHISLGLQEGYIIFP